MHRRRVRRLGLGAGALLLAAGSLVGPGVAAQEGGDRATPMDFFRMGAVIGAPGENIGATDAGAAYVFPTVIPTDKLAAERAVLISESSVGATPHAGDLFGTAVAVGDLNGDGLSDLAIGAPGADNGTGRVYVIFRTPGTGLPDVAHATVLRQGVGGLAGKSEAGDHFGAALQIGHDTDGDGWLAIGAPGEDIGSAVDAGAVTLVPKGTNTVSDRLYYQGSGLPGLAESGDAFGSALGLYGVDGLAVGAPGEDIGSIKDAGHVIGMGADTGRMPGTGVKTSFRQGAGGVPGTSEPGDRFGAALTGRLANVFTVGAPGEDVGSINGAGAITDIPVPGHCCVTATSWYQGKAGLAGTAEAGDAFGASLASNPEGTLFVGAPLEDVSNISDAGVIHEIPMVGGADATLSSANDRSFHQSSPGIAGTAETGDRFGGALGAQPGALVVGIPGEKVSAYSGAGALVVLPESLGLIEVAYGTQQIHEDSPGVPGAARTNDLFGWAVATRISPSES